jgi:hypothetical protein
VIDAGSAEVLGEPFVDRRLLQPRSSGQAARLQRVPTPLIV